MNENSFVFFSLLEESYVLDAEIRLGDIAVASVPHLEREASKTILDSYKRRTDDILEILGNEEVSSSQDIRKALNQT